MSLRRCQVRDLFTITSRRITDEGYLVAPASVSRTGVQVYLARELGLDKDGVDGNKEIRLMRTHAEVFAPEAMASFDRKPITNDHPPEGVNAENWSGTAVGDVHDPVCAGETMDMETVVRDKPAVDAVVKDGKVEMSCGYSFDLDMTPGTAPDGQAYDGLQRKIRGNHVAIVDYARGGSGLRIADRDPNRNKRRAPMSMKKFAIDRIPFEMEEDQAQLVEKVVGDRDASLKIATDSVTTLTARATDAETKLAAATKANADLATAHDAKVKELQAQILTGDQQEALVQERMKVVADALALVPEFKAEKKPVGKIRAEVLTAVMAADEDLKAFAEAVLKGVDPTKPTAENAKDICHAFDALVAHVSAHAGDDELSVVRARDAEIGAALAGKRPSTAAKPKKLVGRALYMDRKQNGFKAEAAE